MEGYFPAKMKRKDLFEVNDDFSDFSLSSPARKIRRLDAELPPIIEEEEPVNPIGFGHPVLSQDTFVEQEVRGSPVEICDLPENEERAIVLFDPMNNMPSLQSRSPFSISVNSDLLSGFKNPVLWSNPFKPFEREKDNQENNSGLSNGCLAVVPWVPKHSHHSPAPEMDAPQEETSEMMDADDTEATTMEIEDEDGDKYPRIISRNEVGSMSVSEGPNQWQQYCMVPQPPHNLSTAVTWSG